MRRLPLLSLLAAGLLLIGCQDQLTSPNTETGPATGVQGPPGNAGPPGQQATCDVTVSPTPNPDIQPAVDAASAGATVCVENGTYREQVVITKDLTLKGLDSPTIEAPDDRAEFSIVESERGNGLNTWEPIVFAYGGTENNGVVSGSETIDVSVSGFKIDGRGIQPDARRAVGIFFRNVQSTKGITDNDVRRMGVGGRETMGILAYGDSDVRIAGNRVEDVERGGIGANGDGGAHPSPEVIITNNTVIGTDDSDKAPNRGARGWASNGIQVGFGATGQITNNVVKDNWWGLAAWSASGILVFESDNVTVRGNQLTNNERAIGISAYGWFRNSADGNRVIRNTVSGAGVGVLVLAVDFPGFTQMDFSVDNTKVTNNTLDGQGGDFGVYLAESNDDTNPHTASLGNTKVIANRIAGFGTDVQDEATDSKVHANRPYSP